VQRVRESHEIAMMDLDERIKIKQEIANENRVAEIEKKLMALRQHVSFIPEVLWNPSRYIFINLFFLISGGSCQSRTFQQRPNVDILRRCYHQWIKWSSQERNSLILIYEGCSESNALGIIYRNRFNKKIQSKLLH